MTMTSHSRIHPSPGDIVRTNYTDNRWRVVEVWPGTGNDRKSFTLVVVDADRGGKYAYLHDYRLNHDGRILGQHYTPGSAMHRCLHHDPPWNELGYTEIQILEHTPQPDLFTR